MSKIFEAIKQAEAARQATEPDSPEREAGSVSEGARAQPGNSGCSAPAPVPQRPEPVEQNPSTATQGAATQGGILAPAPVVQNGHAKVSGPARVSPLNLTVTAEAVARSAGDEKTGGLAGLIRRRWFRRKANDSQPNSTFGNFGTTLEGVAESSFWRWFQFEKTHEENNAHRFESGKPALKSVCYIDVTVSARNELRAFTLSIQRSFINGEGEPFARDLVRSFLWSAFPEDKSEAVSQLINELGGELVAPRPVPGTEEVHHSPMRLTPSPLYLVFVGQGNRGEAESGQFLLEAENSREEPARWFRLRIRPSPVKKTRSRQNR